MNDSEVKNIKSKKYTFQGILLIVDIVGILILIALFAISRVMNKGNDEYILFKGFKFYNIPSDVEFKVGNDGIIILKGTGWTAYADFAGDYSDFILSSADKMNQLLNYKYNVFDVSKVSIASEPVMIVKYDNGDEKGVICYFKSSTTPYVFELRLNNDDNSFNTNQLNKLIPIFKNAVFDEELSKNYDIKYINRIVDSSGDENNNN